MSRTEPTPLRRLPFALLVTLAALATVTATARAQPNPYRTIDA
jgi:hypothetical protein